jgi:phosphate acetyltransferase
LTNTIQPVKFFPMDILSRFLEQVRASPRRLVLAEGEDLRTLKAADRLLAEKAVGMLFLLGDPELMNKTADENDLDISGASLIQPESSSDYEDYAIDYVRFHGHGMDRLKALTFLKDGLAYGCMMVRKDVCDAMVGGAVHTTADLIKDAFFVVGLAEGIKTVSSSFLIVHPDRSFGKEGVMVFADCAVTPNPNPHQLADITVSTVRTFRKLVGNDPHVALLSFSTKGSARHADVEKVVAAGEELKNRNVDFVFDAELQFDAASIPSIAAMKAPASGTAGRANIFIFPDLDAGNIGYKITERLAGATALGPILQGLCKPVNDLSRGCSWEDIYRVALLTQCQV